MKLVFILLGSIRCGNDNPDILSELSALLNQLYKDNKINKLLYKSLYYKEQNALDKIELRALINYEEVNGYK